MDVSIDSTQTGLNAGAEVCVSIDALEPGDIIATANPAKSSRFIQAVTNAPFSHVILYRGSRRAIDAVPGDGVRADLLRELLGNSSLAAVFRNTNASREQRELAAKWAMKQEGAPLRQHRRRTRCRGAWGSRACADAHATTPASA